MAVVRIVDLREGVVGIRGHVVWNYLLHDDTGVVCLDTGWGFHGARVKRWFKSQGRPSSDLRAIVLTHGHIDHMGCAAELQKWSGAPIYLHEADADLALGRFKGVWPSKTLQRIEGAGKLLWWIRKLRINQHLVDGQELPFWGGLRVIHLPGHTPGHVALYSPTRRILFAADAILSRGPRVFFPSRLMNSDDRLARTSVLRLIDLDIDWIYPAHHRDLAHNLMDDIRRYASTRANELGQTFRANGIPQIKVAESKDT